MINIFILPKLIISNLPLITTFSGRFLSSLNQIRLGLSLTDIENWIIFILLIRFVLLSYRYNIKTSFYITCIGSAAGYLWYRRLLTAVSSYSEHIIDIPYFSQLALDITSLSDRNQEIYLNAYNLKDKGQFYNPMKILFYGVQKSIITRDPQTGLQYYIDPISMFISNLDESTQAKILPVYYSLWTKFIPNIIISIRNFRNQISSVLLYALITRVGKKYCPYLIRWHWTLLILYTLVEQPLYKLISRISSYQQNILLPKLIAEKMLQEELNGQTPEVPDEFLGMIPEIRKIPELETDITNDTVLNNILQPIKDNFYSPLENIVNFMNINDTSIQIEFLDIIINFLVSFELGFLLFGLFHAIWGQYFYFPFLVENVELHIGQRLKNSIYSGGGTAWQDRKKQKNQQTFPQFWYGWFGNGLNNNFIKKCKNLILECKKIFKSKH